jgi:NADPH:quinone reductase-like Zn-dependent oxidoreductase
VSNVALIESDLPWAELAAIPKTYATAWTCPFRNLGIKAGRTVPIRGATSSVRVWASVLPKRVMDADEANGKRPSFIERGAKA